MNAETTAAAQRYRRIPRYHQLIFWLGLLGALLIGQTVLVLFRKNTSRWSTDMILFSESEQNMDIAYTDISKNTVSQLNLRPELPSKSFLMKNDKKEDNRDNWSWIDTSGVQLLRIHGDSSTCTDVIYTGDSRLPLLPALDKDEDVFVYASWEALSHIVQLSPTLQQRTCLAYFTIHQPFWDDATQQDLNPVWGRVPATALMMQTFVKAEYFLYMDGDSTLALPDYSPADMYHALLPPINRSNNNLLPGLIVNKPMTGWLCGQCEKYGLGHGCFNSGVLLWRKSRQAKVILRAWWESRLTEKADNFFRNNKEDGTTEYFHGWSSPDHADVTDKMGEQNRLMYIYKTNPAMKHAIWPVPRAPNEENQSTSCPNALDAVHTPCLQDDFASKAKWNESGEPFCFVNHYADDKSQLLDVLELIMISFRDFLREKKQGEQKRSTCDGFVSKDSHDEEDDFNRWSFEQRNALFPEFRTLYWDARHDFRIFLQRLGNDLHDAQGNKATKIWSDTKRDLVLTERMCTAARDFERTGSRKKHVAIMHLNENWGAFSGRVPNRTVDWSTMPETFGNCASYKQAMKYLNHANTKAIITAQFQEIDHPKVHSIPLGLSDEMQDTPKIHCFADRTELLMINVKETPQRKPLVDIVIRNFNGTVHNTYGMNMDGYIAELIRSKFVLSPSGLGWDCYRHWEALTYGAIPIIEHYNRKDGWFRVFEGLPVLWVSTFNEVTPELLHKEYKRLSRVRNYTFQKLTSDYWINFVHSLRPKARTAKKSSAPIEVN